MSSAISIGTETVWLLFRAALLRRANGTPALTGLASRPGSGPRFSSGEVRILERIVEMRSQLGQSQEAIEVQDFGTGASQGNRRRAIREIHRTSAIPHRWGVLLFSLVRRLRPRKILELGTSLGVSASYVEAAIEANDHEAELFSVEGDPRLAEIARRNLARISSHPAEVIVGTFRDVLPSLLQRMENVDLAFIDGHHEYAATMEYFRTLRPFLSPGACVVLDDVYPWTRPVRKAWKHIVLESPEAVSVDLAKLGILFFPQHQ